MKLQESAEDYLESIWVLGQDGDVVHSVDVARHMEFSKPSVSRAMGLLRENGYIAIARDGGITLTPEGREVATSIYERHQLLTRWLTALGVPPETAVADACRIEHDVSEATFLKMKAHILGELGEDN